jgi:hypothetical protein
MLLEKFASLLQESWRPVFAQQRTQNRAVEHALSLPLVLGRRTVSRTICALGRAQQDWSADYKLFSRSDWKPAALFDPVLNEYLARYPKGPIAVSLDDSGYPKTGAHIPGAQWQRDPMSPPFQVNLRWGLRFLQASCLFPLHQEGAFAARALPVRFDPAPLVKKPGKRATAEEQREYKKMKKQFNLSTQAVEQLRGLRQQLDEKQARARLLLAAVDGSFCNRTLFKTSWDRTVLVARSRKDACLCRPAATKGRRRYDPVRFTPEAVRQDPQIPYRRVRVYYGNQRRWARVKVVMPILWRRGAGTKSLRLLIIAPHPYKRSKQGKTYYRGPAYLLTLDLKSSVKHLVQTYFDRWEIEVNHRDQKSLLGVGQAQLWSEHSVPRHPALAVASYSLLLLTGLRTFGPGRSDAFALLPKWRKKSNRFSLLDLLSMLRKDLSIETSVSRFLNAQILQNLVQYADT